MKHVSNLGQQAPRVILFLDSSYTLKMIRQRQLEQALDSRSLNGYFSRVISVHPLAGLFEMGHDRHGHPTVTKLDDCQTFVEGTVGLTRWLKALPPLNFLLAQISLIRLLIRLGRDTGVSVVRASDPYYLAIVGLILARYLNVPLALRVGSRFDDVRKFNGRANMPRLFMFQWVEKCVERFIFPRCDLIAGANEDNLQFSLENGGRSEVSTVFRIGNLLHPSHWIDPISRPDPQPDLEECGLSGKRFVVTISRLVPMKRLDEMIRAVGELVRRGHDIYGLIVGDGELREQLTAYSRSLGLAERIVFAGIRNQEWIARVLPKATVIVSTHMGRALAEAALSAVPIVALDYDWHREVVVNDETGYLIRNGGWFEMADKMELLLENPIQAKLMGTNVRAKVSKMMNPDLLIKHEQDVYSALLQGATINPSATEDTSSPSTQTDGRSN